MNIGEELDKLAAEGRVTNVTLAGRTRDGWQCYLKMGRANNYVARGGATPAAALAAAIEGLPGDEAYELKYGATGVNARAQAEEKPAPEDAGIFD
jgi:hypothetical protein